ncbi:MAG: BamA/TamA family outer membrane protein [Bacteroidales bacterium]|nr:BamA/TamA family outer membrane protein [Bacteroidales bacterium]
MRSGFWIFGVLCAVLLLSSCSSTKHVPAGEYLLDKVHIVVKDNEEIETAELYNFLRQQPNHKVLGFAKLSLSTYSLSGSDTTKWYNRWLRSLGQPPVIYDPDQTEGSRKQLELALVNRGYMDARVETDVDGSEESRKMDVTFSIYAGRPHRVRSVRYNIPDPIVDGIVTADSAASELYAGMLLDRNVLDNERGRVASLLRNAGYYDFNREYINYTADTVAGSEWVDLTMNLYSPGSRPGSALRASLSDSLHLSADRHHRYEVMRVVFVVDADLSGRADALADTVEYRGNLFIYGNDRYLRPAILDEMCMIQSRRPYNARSVERTYEALGRLSIVKFINIEMVPVGAVGDVGMLDAYIYLSRNKKMTASVELEGTNSEGDLGFGVGLGFQHRNLGRGSELLSAKFRTSYESLSGNFEGLVNKRYSEYAGEVGLTFPQFKAPFLSRSFKQRILASSELALSFNYQERPEYTRIIWGLGWKYKWQQQRWGYTRRHTYDLVDINYVRLPRSTIDFINQIAPTNPLLRYSYEDHFIMRMGYTFQTTNKRVPSAGSGTGSFQPVVTNLRTSVETAGNLLYGISKLVKQRKHDDVYKILGIQYAQYVKGEVDYTFTRNFTPRSSLAMHGGFGIAVPYGNSSMVPFEKRFYGGGANGVRGWGVRTLGPGAYDARNSVTDFINQCGDISLDLSLEYRHKIFWVIEGAVFADAGNIWTIRDYENQPGGVFKFNTFYKQIAAAYGAGIRLDFTYFLLRLDLGLKAVNPAQNQEHWPIIHPKWSRDATFHFSVGYPF